MARRLPLRRWVGLLTVTCVAVGLAACGGPRPPAAVSDGSSTTTTTPAATTTTTTLPAGAIVFGSPSVVDTTAGLSAVSCGSPTSCVAVDGSGRAFVFNGTSWAGPVPAAAQGLGPGMISVSCSSATQCVANATASSQIVEWNGTTWGAPATLAGSTGLGAVGCAPDGYCAAVDAEGNAWEYTRGTWVRTSGDWGSASSIACVSSTFCVSVSGGLSVWNGSSWTQPNPYGSTSSFTGVSCPSASYCVAVDQVGQALSWNGQTWSQPAQIEAGPPPSGTSTAIGPEPTGVSCPSTSLCVAVDNTGNVIQSVRGTLTHTAVDPGHQLNGISCPTPTFCVAVDQSGRVLLGRS